MESPVIAVTAESLAGLVSSGAISGLVAFLGKRVLDDYKEKLAAVEARLTAVEDVCKTSAKEHDRRLNALEKDLAVLDARTLTSRR